MSITLLVWVLIVSNVEAPTVQLGDYADLESCQRAQSAIPESNYWTHKCVQVNKVYAVKEGKI